MQTLIRLKYTDVGINQYLKLQCFHDLNNQFLSICKINYVF